MLHLIRILKRYMSRCIRMVAMPVGAGLVALALTGCAGEDSHAPKGETMFSIGARASVPGLDADGNEIPSATDDNELINDWFIAFVDESGTVARIVRRYPSGSTQSASPVELDFFNTQLAPGDYTAVAFANIDPADLGLTFSEGSQAPAGALGDAPFTINAGALTASDLIPMAGRQKVRVTGQVTQPFSIEVVRLVAKVELMFSNATDSGITLHNLWMRPMGKGNVNLFPDYSSLGKRPALRADADTLTMVRRLDATLTPMSERSVTHTFYTLESDASKFHKTGHYALLLDVTHRSGDTGRAVRDTVTMLTPDLTYINRNDYIRIPVRLADYVVRMDVQFYPPIGGYPAVVNEQRGSDFYISFGTQGVFSITPLVREAVAGSQWMQPSQLGIEVLAVEGDPIFAVKPTYDSSTGEITGELNASEGTAVVTIKTDIPGTRLSYERKIYIIRDNRKK